MPLPANAAAFAHGWLANQGLHASGYVVLGLGARRPKKQPSVEQVLPPKQVEHAADLRIDEAERIGEYRARHPAAMLAQIASRLAQPSDG